MCFGGAIYIYIYIVNVCRFSFFLAHLFRSRCSLKVLPAEVMWIIYDTVDGRKPAPSGMHETL